MELEIGCNYATVFFDSPAPGKQGKQVIYMGGIRFKAINEAGQIMERDSQDTYNKVKAYISTPNIMMGRVG